MTRITQNPQGGPLEVFQTSTESQFSTYAGMKFITSDGRELTLVRNGGTALASGVLVQSPAIVANHQNTAVTAVTAAGSTSLTVTLGATAVTANQYAGGYVVVNAGTGIGQTLMIASHPAANASANLTLSLEDPVQVALDTSSRVCLHANPAAGVIINPTTSTGGPVGVTINPIPANAYGLVVNKGFVSCLAQGAIGAGLGIAPSTTTAGAVTVMAATLACIGNAYQAGVTGESRAVYVNL